ncbi:MAG: hypothetical protein Q9199_005365 [Rusavskia elegans]
MGDFSNIDYSGDFANRLTCTTLGPSTPGVLPTATTPGLSQNPVLSIAIALTPHGSMGQGSALPPATRCPRAKPTTTITSLVTSGESVVATAHGFTPISSENYLATSSPNSGIKPIVVSIYGRDRFTTIGESRLPSFGCAPLRTGYSDISPTPTTCPTLSTVTTSTTITSPSSVSYDACGSDNIVTFVTDPSRDNQRSSISSLTLYNVTTNVELSDIGAPRCCAACQRLGCAYGFWSESPFAYCQLYFQDDCDGKEWLGSTFSYETPDSLNPVKPGDGMVVFNGPCGQIAPAGPST